MGGPRIAEIVTVAIRYRHGNFGKSLIQRLPMLPEVLASRIRVAGQDTMLDAIEVEMLALERAMERAAAGIIGVEMT